MRKFTFLMIATFSVITFGLMSCDSDDDSSGATEVPHESEMVEIEDKAFAEYLIFRGVRGVTWEIINGEERFFLIPEKVKKVEELSLAKTSGSISSLASGGVKTAETKITNVSELKYFTGLRALTLSTNEIEVLDLTSLEELEVLQINNNLINELDLTNNPNLIKLRYKANSKALDHQKLSEINLNENFELEHLHLPGHNLVEVDLSNNENLIDRLDLSGNPGPEGYGNIVIPERIFNQVPSSERLGVVSDADNSDVLVEIPDPVFGDYLVNYAKVSGVIVEEEGNTKKYYLDSTIVANEESLSLSKTSGRIKDLISEGLETAEDKITDLSGIEYFTGLKTLTLSSNDIEVLDLTRLEQLEVLQINNNLIGDLDLSKNKNLIKLRYSASSHATDSQKLSTIDLKANVELEHLHLPGHNLTEIDLSENLKLTDRLDLRDNPGPNGTGDIVVPKVIYDQVDDKWNVVSDE